MNGTLVTYSANELRPAIEPQEALIMAVRLPAGINYPVGCVLAEVLGTGTAVSEVQTGTITGSPTGGSFQLEYMGQRTGAIAYNATGATVQTAMLALSNIGAGNMTVTGGAGGPYVFTFSGVLGGLNQPMITVIPAFTGGTNPALTIVETTPGKPAAGHFIAYVDGSLEPAKALLRYAVTTDEQGNVSIGSDYNNKQLTAEAYFSGYYYTADLPSAGVGALDANAVADLGRMYIGTTAGLTTAGNIIRVR